MDRAHPDRLVPVLQSTYIACGVLYGDVDTVRHDMESFLYVLFWVVFTFSPDGKQGHSKGGAVKEEFGNGWNLQKHDQYQNCVG